MKIRTHAAARPILSTLLCATLLLQSTPLTALALDEVQLDGEAVAAELQDEAAEADDTAADQIAMPEITPEEEQAIEPLAEDPAPQAEEDPAEEEPTTVEAPATEDHDDSLVLLESSLPAPEQVAANNIDLAAASTYKIPLGKSKRIWSLDGWSKSGDYAYYGEVTRYTYKLNKPTNVVFTLKNTGYGEGTIHLRIVQTGTKYGDYESETWTIKPGETRRIDTHWIKGSYELRIYGDPQRKASPSYNISAKCHEPTQPVYDYNSIDNPIATLNSGAISGATFVLNPEIRRHDYWKTSYIPKGANITIKWEAECPSRGFEPVECIELRNAQGQTVRTSSTTKQTCSYRNLEAGTYYIYVRATAQSQENPDLGCGGYIVSWDFTGFCALPIADATVLKIADCAYNGTAKRPKPVVKLSDETLIYGKDYTLTYKNNIKVGTAKVTIKGKGNYTGSKTVTFKIKKSLAKARIASMGKRFHTGKAIKPRPKVTYGGKALKYGVDYTLSYKHNTKPGKATVTIKGKGSYAGSRTVAFRIISYKKTATTFETADFKVSVPKKWKGKWSVRHWNGTWIFHQRYTENRARGYESGDGQIIVTSSSSKPLNASYSHPFFGRSKNGKYVWQGAGAAAGFFSKGARVRVK